MTNYVICERSLHHAHAGSKARDDIRQVLESQSWQPFEVRPGENKGYFDKLVCVRLPIGIGWNEPFVAGMWCWCNFRSSCTTRCRCTPCLPCVG